MLTLMKEKLVSPIHWSIKSIEVLTGREDYKEWETKVIWTIKVPTYQDGSLHKTDIIPENIDTSICAYPRCSVYSTCIVTTIAFNIKNALSGRFRYIYKAIDSN